MRSTSRRRAPSSSGPRKRSRRRQPLMIPENVVLWHGRVPSFEPSPAAPSTEDRSIRSTACRTRLVIDGGRRLEGVLQAPGAKNAALPIMAASILAEGEVVLHRVPRITDVDVMAAILESLGARVREQSGGTLVIDTSSMNSFAAPYALVSQSQRIVRRHRRADRAFRARRSAATRRLRHRSARGRSPPQGLRSARRRHQPRTRRDHRERARRARRRERHVIEALASARPRTSCSPRPKRAARPSSRTPHSEPEVVDLADFLNALGARIRGQGSPTITIDGVRKLHGCEYTVIPDRIVAGTYLIAGAITAGDVTRRGIGSDDGRGAEPQAACHRRNRRLPRGQRARKGDSSLAARRRRDGAISGVPDRYASAVRRISEFGKGNVARRRNYIRRAIRLRERARSHGRGHQGLGSQRSRHRGRQAQGRGRRSARHQSGRRPRAGSACGARARRRSAAWNSSIAATSSSKRSCERSARRSMRVERTRARAAARGHHRDGDAAPGSDAVRASDDRPTKVDRYRYKEASWISESIWARRTSSSTSAAKASYCASPRSSRATCAAARRSPSAKRRARCSARRRATSKRSARCATASSPTSKSPRRCSTTSSRR